jgi:predicted DNA-binding transcriptional regulator AlpA
VRTKQPSPGGTRDERVAQPLTGPGGGRCGNGRHGGRDSRFFNRKALAAFLLISTRTLDRLDSNDKLPPSLRIGGGKRWTRASIELWLRLGCPGREGMATPDVGRK